MNHPTAPMATATVTALSSCRQLSHPARHHRRVSSLRIAGSVRCSTTGHVMSARLHTLKEHWGGKCYRMAAMPPKKARATTHRTRRHAPHAPPRTGPHTPPRTATRGLAQLSLSTPMPREHALRAAHTASAPR